MNQFDVSKRSIRLFYTVFVILFLLITVVLWQQVQSREKSQLAKVDNEVTEEKIVNEPIQPIPLHLSLNKKKVALGDKLFHESQLSHNNNISCASCHNLSTGGVDRLVRSVGGNREITAVNSPTVFNSAFNFKLDWNGQFETLEDHIGGAINTPDRMDSNWAEVIEKLKKSPDYVKAFDQLYDEGITDETIKDAIATFERSLYTPNSRFDQFLRGNNQAITAAEKEGYRLFKTYGCVSCHQGVIIGGNLLQKFGIMGDYFGDRGKITKADFGRFNVTGKEEDRYVFKVPGLRNITLTPPYFHDGSAETLKQAIAVMAKYQLGRELSTEKIDLIIKFLTTLTGEYQGKPL